jgi:hypothetical protein
MPHILEKKPTRPAETQSVAAHRPSWFEVHRAHGPNVGLARDLLRDPAQVAAVDPWLKPLLGDATVVAAIERDEVPIAAPADREGYFGDRPLAYWLSGCEDLRLVRDLVPASALSRVLDFGGASGRFARHVALADESSVATIAELNVNYVTWVAQNFGPDVRAVKVSPYPHFPLADRSITLCVAFSVFTHIDSYESGWLAEINRVLTDDGYAMLTIHSEHCWPLIADRAPLMDALRKDPTFESHYRPGEPMPAERLVFEYNRHSIEHNCNVFFHTNYIRRVWGKWFEVVDIRPQAHHHFQTAVVLRKRA